MRNVCFVIALVFLSACSAMYGQGVITGFELKGTAGPHPKLTPAQWRLSVVEWYMIRRQR
jgi:hypothetical protein